MIKDEVIYKGQVILTVYHCGISDSLSDRNVKRNKKIGRYNILFKETLADFIDNENAWVQKEDGILKPLSPLNPYSDSVCANMTRYCYFNKPESIFKLDNDKYSFKIPVKDFCSIAEFIKEYIGMNIRKKPMALGDVFVFEPRELKYRSNEKESVIIENPPADSLIVIHFKMNDIIVSSQCIKTDNDKNDVEIECNKTWNNHDIEVFQNEQLIYHNTGITYIREFNLQMTLKTPGKPVKLSKIGTNHVPDRISSENVIHWGKQPEYYSGIFKKSELELTKQIEQEQPDDRVIFIKPNQCAEVNKIIVNEIESANDSIWLFDSYFSDMDGIGYSFDWLRIIANCKAKSKNIVFFCNNEEKALSINGLINRINNDVDLGFYKRDNKTIGIKLYQTQFPIHDRFLLVENSTGYSGLIIGTSFNSLYDNYYCISRLSYAASKNILEELKSWLNDGNVISYKEL